MPSRLIKPEECERCQKTTARELIEYTRHDAGATLRYACAKCGRPEIFARWNAKHWPMIAPPQP